MSRKRNIATFFRDMGSHQLSYTISRSYPFGRWLTPTVFGIAVLLFIASTIFNIATIGFSVQNSYRSDPNATESERHWYNSWIFTWGDVKLNPSCQHLDIPIGFKFMTRRLGLQYTLQSIVQQNVQNAGLKSEQLTSVSYLNNHLMNCTVDQMNINLRKVDQSRPGENYWWSWTDSDADATVSCNTTTDKGLFTIAFTTEYSATAGVSDVSSLDNLVGLDNTTTRASFWWATRLLSAYSTGIRMAMSAAAAPSTPVWTRGRITFSPGTADSIKDPLIFTPGYWFIDEAGSLITPESRPGTSTTNYYNNHSLPESIPVTEGLSFAKVFHSLIMADLGDSTSPNVLLDPELLRYALAPNDNFNRRPGGPLYYNDSRVDWWRWCGIAPPNTSRPSATTSIHMDQAYDRLKGQFGPLGTQPTSIYAQYVCSVPVRRGIPSVVVLTLVANLTLLQIAWQTFVFFADKVVKHRDPTASHCDGCVAHAPKYEVANPNALASKNPTSRHTSTESIRSVPYSVAHEPLIQRRDEAHSEA